MYRMTILYGMPNDPEHFPLYEVIAEAGLGWNLSWVEATGEEPPIYLLVAELYAESQAAMTAILDSPGGVAAREDLDNFVTGSVEFLAGGQEEVALA